MAVPAAPAAVRIAWAGPVPAWRAVMPAVNAGEPAAVPPV
jgi:hypothetical protein